MSINRTYKYADELVEGDIIQHWMGEFSVHRAWFVVAAARTVGDATSLRLQQVAGEEVVQTVVRAIQGYEVATIESHPEVLQQLVDQISDLQAEQAPPADTQCKTYRWSEPEEGFTDLLFRCQLTAGHKELHDGITGEYRLYWRDEQAPADVVHDDDPDADELPKASL